jgi:branched-chain amino acid transport system permease protein
VSAVGAQEATARSLRIGSRGGRLGELTAWILIGLVSLLILLWVLFLAPTTGKFATSFGSAVHDPKDFLITVLDGVTAAGLYFVVASGFTSR